ncbi:MAG TPA: hypothetical protein VGW75_13340 [Solirubrobacteraceae bacterium]|nr:hypothetical protein [Solirubrobacteraceae bacterium]
MNGHELAVVQGWADTRATLRAWNAAPGPVLGRWVRLSLLVTAGLLAAVLAVAAVSTPDATPMLLPGVNTAPDWADVGAVVFRNSLVLALHALACLAGFIAMSSLPIEAEAYSGRWRALHDVAGPAAIAFVTAATLFSVGTQALVLGDGLSTLAWQLDVAPAKLLAILSIHAVPELCALFLPLAAWLVAARAGAWEQLMAATIVTAALAFPVVAISAMVEIWLTPRFL